ncbi:hypothetical protein ATCC90586_007479 [Pythium insidiosum]|nr:hypothetical protein ATCC90586_007479 [Pythium insidiosum]
MVAPMLFRRSFATKKAAAVSRVRGTRDLLPDDAESHHVVVDALRQVVQRYGFRQIQTPMLEYTDLFTRSLGDGSDIVMKEMYTFNDNSGKSVTLRPEGTAGVMRALVTNGLPVSPPQKLFYHGSMFRYERPQRGRYREFQQFGVEFIGSTGPSVDTEAIAMAAHALDALGIRQKTSLQLNSIGDTESRQHYRTALDEYFSKFKSELSADSISRLERGSVLRILDSKSDSDQRIIADAPQLKEYLSSDSLRRFEAVLDGLAALGVDAVENPRLVRGLDYYSHTVFEFVERVDNDNGGIAVLAGGCYDGLSETLGGAPVSCIGWAAGVDRLGLLREGVTAPQHIIAVVPVLAGTTDDTVLHEALRTAQVLRDCGHIVHFCHGHGNMKKQMKAADRLGSNFAVIVGGDEVAQRQVRIKDLANRSECSIACDELAAYKFA